MQLWAARAASRYDCFMENCVGPLTVQRWPNSAEDTSDQRTYGDPNSARAATIDGSRTTTQQRLGPSVRRVHPMA